MPRSYYCRRLELPPDPMLLARSLALCPGAFLLRSSGRRHVAFLGAWPCEHSLALCPEPRTRSGTSDAVFGDLPRWIGILPYEAFRSIEANRSSLAPAESRPAPLFQRCEWWRYGAVAVVDEGVRVIGDDAAAIERLAAQLGCVVPPEVTAIDWLGDSESDDAHAARIQSLLRDIARGRFYQVNLARSFHFAVRGSALGLYERLFASATVPFGIALDAGQGRRIAGASPELCLDAAADDRLLTRPIKGTRPRGGSHAEDVALIRELASDPKEIAELNMVIDLERNDFGAIAQTGSVEVVSAGEVESYEAVHHRVATLRARLRPGVNFEELLRRFLPSGSVTGTPKQAAMSAIASLESERRGLYTGALGFLAHDGTLRLAMAIRTLVADAAGQAVYRTGGGIVADSVPERETAETRWKARQLLAPKLSGPAAEPVEFDPTLGRNFAKNWADWMGSGTEE